MTWGLRFIVLIREFLHVSVNLMLDFRHSIHPFNKSNICRFPLMTSNSCFQILFRNVQRPKTFPISFLV